MSQWFRDHHSLRVNTVRNPPCPATPQPIGGLMRGAPRPRSISPLLEPAPCRIGPSYFTTPTTIPIEVESKRLRQPETDCIGSRDLCVQFRASEPRSTRIFLPHNSAVSSKSMWGLGSGHRLCRSALLIARRSTQVEAIVLRCAVTTHPIFSSLTTLKKNR